MRQLFLLLLTSAGAASGSHAGYVHVLTLVNGHGGSRIFALDAEHVWVTDAVKLYSTRDAGKKWAARDLPSCSDLKRSAGTVEFVDERQGVYVQGECITKTSDGGETWGPLGLQPKRGSLVYAADFDTSLQKSFVAGCICVPRLATEGVPNFALCDQQGKERSAATVFITSDGGGSWQDSMLPSSPPRRAFCAVSVKIVGTSVVALARNNIFRSPDMGKTWAAVRFDPKCSRPHFPEEFENVPVTMAFAGREYGWVSYRDGDLLRTVDGGATCCSVEHNDSDHVFWQMTFRSSTEGWAVDDHSLLHTTDGRKTWNREELRANDVLVSGADLWVTTHSGVYHRTLAPK